METEPTIEDGWNRIFALMRRKYPSASEGILFCVHKLQQDRELRLVDFRDEAKLHGISLGGRSVHSAKVLLGMERPSVRRSKQDHERSEPARQGKRRNQAAPTSASAEDTLIEAVKQIQEAASSESMQLRKAIRQAVEILQRAL